MVEKMNYKQLAVPVNMAEGAATQLVLEVGKTAQAAGRTLQAWLNN